MKFQIRKNVFETNSSSSHSIVVTKDDHKLTKKDFSVYPEKIYLHNGVWEIAFDEDELEFGRYPMKILSTLSDKVRFVFADYCGYLSSEDADKKAAEIVVVLKTIIPGLSSVSFPKKYEMVYETPTGELVSGPIVHTDWEDGEAFDYILKAGEKVPVTESEKYSTKVNYYGFVDHQSQGLIENFIITKGINLKEFLSNRKYIICIDGDEYDSWGNLKYSGLINIANIEEEFGESSEYRSYLESLEKG